jgi:DNA polymerase III alpha subunit
MYQTSGFTLFQENLLKFFEWLGVSPAISIGLIKKIAKKKIKPKDFSNLEEQLRQGWIKQVGNDDDFDSIWKDMQHQMSYGFNVGHGYATACDALYGAYLKVNYPIEYYTVVLDLYKDDADRTLRLVQELNYFDIKFDNKVKFRYSSDEYRFDKENNTIYKGIGSIKNIGKSCGDNLYELKDNHYDYFIDLLDAIYNSPQGKLANKTELIILICIDFFSEFGDLSKLLNILKVYEQYHKRKTLKKAEIADSIFLERHVKTHCAKETDKQYSGVDMLRLLELYERDNIWDKKTTELRHLVYEIAYIGFTERTVPTLGDDIRVVVGVEVNKYGTPFITLYKPSDGTTDTYKLNKWWYKEYTVVAGDTIRIAMKERSKHVKNENNEWVETDEEEKFIENYYIAKRFEELTIDFP